MRELALSEALFPTRRKIVSTSVNKIALAGTALLLAAGLAACSAGTGTPESNQSEAPAAQSAESAEPEADLFSDPEFNFQIALPAEPVVQPINEEVEGVQIVGNMYLTEISNEEAYVIGVSRYEMTDPDAVWDDRASLEGAVQGMVSNVDGTIVTTSNEGTLLGYPSSETLFTVEADGLTFDGRSQMVIRDQTLYNIMGMGVSEEDFNALVASFSFLD